MKRKYYILGTLALLCLLGTGCYVWTLYDAHCKQVVEWNEGAKAAFEEALWLEVNKRAEIPIYHSTSSKHGMESFNEILPDTIFITTSLGRKGYYIAPIRYERSFIKDKDKKRIYFIHYNEIAKNYLKNKKICKFIYWILKSKKPIESLRYQIRSIINYLRKGR